MGKNKVAIALSTAVVVLAAILVLMLVHGNHNNGDNSSSGYSIFEHAAAEDPAKLAAEAADRCDRLATQPGDPSGRKTPVSDEQLAIGDAVTACEEAVKYAPNDPRLQFELGRAYWAAHRDFEAVHQFAASAEQKYAAAKKYLGDAYYMDRGLPDGQTPNAQTALKWYQESASGGFSLANASVLEAQTSIRKNTFDRDKFQNSTLMQTIYRGDVLETDHPFAMSYYVQGLVHRLNDDQTIFMDQKCKSLVNIIGGTVIDNAQLVALGKVISKSQKANGDIKWDVVFQGLVENAGQDVWKDQGDRDATVLFDKDVYGCDSTVTQQIIKNIVIATPSYKN